MFLLVWTLTKSALHPDEYAEHAAASTAAAEAAAAAAAAAMGEALDGFGDSA